MGAKGDTSCSDKFTEDFSCGGIPPLLGVSHQSQPSWLTFDQTLILAPSNIQFACLFISGALRGSRRVKKFHQSKISWLTRVGVTEFWIGDSRFSVRRKNPSRLANEKNAFRQSKISWLTLMRTFGSPIGRCEI
jgi:hypothetical protein